MKNQIKHPQPWEIILRHDVEGRTLPVEIEYPTKPTPHDELPKDIDTSINTELLIAYLRSELPVTKYIRNWLADMLEQKPDTDLRLTLSDTKSTASKKKQSKNNIVRRNAALFARAWMKKHETEDKDAAVYETKPHYRLGATTLNKAIDEQKMCESLIKQVKVIRK